MKPLACLVALLLAVPLAQAAPRALLPGPSEIGFSVRQMGVAVSGRFTRFSARIDLDAGKPEASSARVEVDVASLATGDDDADAVARDTPWLDTAHFATAQFQSSAIRRLAPDRYEARGTLTLRGKARELTVPFSTKTAADGTTTASGTLAIKRSEFGVGGGEWNEDDVVADEVQVHFRLVLAPPHP